MNKMICTICGAIIFSITLNLFGQDTENCFLDDFELKTAAIPPSVNSQKPAGPASVTVTVESDTLGKISQYVFGNAIAAWVGSRQTDQKVIDNTKLLNPSLIRFPGGSWADIFFWDGVPADVPDSVYDGTTYNGSTATKVQFWPQSGTGSWPTTTDQYYEFIQQVGTDGLITINYGYARYGLSDDPVAQAAHLAAEWVRYDDGRTKFWEIGNENAGPWEAGWFIDTAANKDGQPQIINGDLYGSHFKVFYDSMKAAADEIDVEIFIGAQILHYDGTSSWNIADRIWNEAVFREAGEYADFYVMHNYFSDASNVKTILEFAVSEPRKNIEFIRQDIINKDAQPKPVAITEYNIGFGGNAIIGTSYINGMQSVILISELIKNNFGLGARWLLVTGEGGMFYDGSDPNYEFHPHPDFYYLHFLRKFYGDHAIRATSSGPDILSYASKYSSGETAVVIVNKGESEAVVRIEPDAIGVGQNYYIYSFTGGTDNGNFSQNVYINSYGPNTNHWGPFNELSNIPADSYPIETEIKFASPGRSVQMILIEGGSNIISGNVETVPERPYSYKLFQNYPNPFNPITRIDYQLPARVRVTLRIYDITGREIETLVSERQNAGNHSVQFNGSNLPSGVYFYKIEAGEYQAAKKLLLVK
jgi:hypothetical protein